MNKQAVNVITNHLNHWKRLSKEKICDETEGKETIEALEAAIKALEQESILDKIRAEIETQEKWLAQAGYNAYNVDIALNTIKLVLAEMESEK